MSRVEVIYWVISSVHVLFCNLPSRGERGRKGGKCKFQNKALGTFDPRNTFSPVSKVHFYLLRFWLSLCYPCQSWIYILNAFNPGQWAHCFLLFFVIISTCGDESSDGPFWASSKARIKETLGNKLKHNHNNRICLTKLLFLQRVFPSMW